MYIHETKLKVRYVETDQMGVVHHSNYYVWFEVARTDFFEAIGLPYDRIEESGIMFPLIESGCIYKEGAKYADNIIIKSCIKEIKGMKFTFLYDVIREKDNKLLAKGKTVHVPVDKDMNLINLKKVNPKLLEEIKNVVLTQ
ncbi:MAG: acyl-CoA thioesterase [Epulopiscium sp.]|nr:acyl-CoA thioesterase [Candidatus Epulonipiscium sp.]